MAIVWQDVTIAGGVIALNGTGHYRVENEGGAATDDITSITGVQLFDAFSLYPKTSGHWWTIHEISGIKLDQGASYTVANMDDHITFRAKGTNSVIEWDRKNYAS